MYGAFFIFNLTLVSMPNGKYRTNSVFSLLSCKK